jgi:hypothetical protein
VLRGSRTGRRIALGDRARVQIVNVNTSSRQLDLRLLEHGSSIGGDTSLRRMEPRNKPKAIGAGGSGFEEAVRPERKKNHVKRQDRKEQARQRARQERHGKHGGSATAGGGAGGSAGGSGGGGGGGPPGRGSGKRNRRGRGRFGR